MLHELFLTTRRKTKIRNAFVNSMPTDVKCSKAQIFELIQSGGFFYSWLGSLGKKALKILVKKCFSLEIIYLD